MKILHVGESVLGGAGTYINEVVPPQKDKFGDRNIAILIPAEHRLHLVHPKLQDLVTFPRPDRKRGFFFLLLAYIRMMRNFRPDIVHAHSTFAGVVARILSPFFKARIVYCPHGWAMDMEQSKLKKRIFSSIEYLLSFLCDRIVAISEYERQRGIGIGICQTKLVTVHNGINQQEPQVEPALWNDERLKVLFVGRLDRQKGVDILLEAIKGIEDKVSVRIIGSSVTNDFAADFGSHPSVTPMGWQEQTVVAANMKACDVLVMPSRWEGFGLTAIEAMRVGKPVFASGVGGLPEVIEDKVTGLLFPVENAKVLRQLLAQANKDSLALMGKAGKSRFLERFTSSAMLRALEEIYLSCLLNHGKTA